MSRPEECSSLFLKLVLFSDFLFSFWVLYPSTEPGKIPVSGKDKKGLWIKEKILQVKENHFSLTLQEAQKKSINTLLFIFVLYFEVWKLTIQQNLLKVITSVTEKNTSFINGILIERGGTFDSLS